MKFRVHLQRTNGTRYAKVYHAPTPGKACELAIREADTPVRVVKCKRVRER